MPDYTKKVIKRRSDVLDLGEQYLGATYALPGGRFGRMVGMGVAGVAGAVVAEKRSKDRADEHGEALGTGLAERVPAGTDLVIAVTDRRLLFFSFKRVKGDPGDLMAEYTLDEVSSIEGEKRKLMFDLLITFADETVVDFEAQKMTKPTALIDGFAQAVG